MSVGSDRKVVFALLGIAALCLIGLGASLYHAKGAELKKLESELSEKRAKLEEVHTKLTELPDLEAKYGDLQSRLSVLEPALPDSAYIPTFLRQIENLARGTKNGILTIRPKPAIRRSAADSVSINEETGEVKRKKQSEGTEAVAVSMPYDFVPIELKLEGTYWTVIDFLAELQQFPKMIAVNDISFSPKSGRADTMTSPSLTATMGLTAVVTKGGKDAKQG
jgi:Tfp pilus assembly protein PilO